MLWTRPLKDGYGSLGIGGGKTRSVHRLSYQHFVGEVPEGLELDHLCRVTNCVNPLHLEPVTHKENLMRGNGICAQYARRTHCENGHELTVNPSSGLRECRPCRLAGYKEWWKANRPPTYVFNRDKTHCKKGHEFTPDNTYFARDVKDRPNPRRHCRTCGREATRRYIQGKKSKAA